MKKVLAAGRTHVIMLVMQLALGVALTVFFSFRYEAEAMSIYGLLWFVLIADGEAFSFIRRSTSWEASRLVPGYNKKIYTTSLCIACAFVAFGILLSFAIGYRTPPIGIALMVAIGLLTLTIHAKRTGNNRLLIGAEGICLCVLIGIPFSLILDVVNLHSLIVTSVSSLVVQFAAFVIAVVAALVLKEEIDRIGAPRSVVDVEVTERIYPRLAGRYRLFGLSAPSENMLAGLLATIPFFVIVGASHSAFANEGSFLLESRDSIKSVIAATCIYLGTGTAFRSLKNPGMWLAKAWQLGIAKSRSSLGSEYARRIVATCVVPSTFALCVALMHAMYVEAPLAEWSGYTNFYDETLLLVILNLLCFTWACGTHPQRTTERPEFLHIRLAICAVTSLIFILGVDFGLVGRVLLATALCCSAALAVYMGGRQIAEIDFVPVKKEVTLFGK